MVKIKPISRDRRDFEAGTKSELAPVRRSAQPELHPFEKSREYVRALNAVKLDKHFAKPFVGALSGHTDSVNCLAKSPAALSTLVSGSCDGEVIRWDLATREPQWRVQAHSGFVRGMAFSRRGHHFVTCSDDKTVKLWSASASAAARTMGSSSYDNDDLAGSDPNKPLATYLGRNAFTDIDHHKKEHNFATGGSTLLLWDTQRSEPIQSFEWGADSITKVRFNPAQHNLLGCLSNDRGVTLYDLKTGSATQKMVMQTRSNALCWNPMEPFHFTLASEDHSLYTFDMRKLDHAICVHTGHVSAVMSVDYNPTGKQFVSGSYDRTVRIWSSGDAKSDATYHTKRMQRLFCVGWSMDSTYLFSGSDDTNLRLWRAKGNERATQSLPREKAKREYEEALVEKFKYMPEVKRIKKHNHVPRAIMKAASIKETVANTQRRHDVNRRKHAAPGKFPKVKAKNKKVWSVLE